MYIVTCFSLSFSTVLFLKKSLPLVESNKACLVINYNVKQLASMCNRARNENIGGKQSKYKNLHIIIQDTIKMK